MNSYSLGISSSWYIAVASVLFAFVISYFYYKSTIPLISNTSKTVLFLLRSFALSLLLFIIFEPVFSIINSKIAEPKIAVILDRSISMSLKDGRYNRIQVLSDVLEKLNLANSEINSELIIFDKSYSKLDDINNLDSIPFGDGTDISKAFEWVKEMTKAENISSILLISDGAFNTGQNPMYIAEELGKPIYSIGIGDTSSPRDIALNSMFLNRTANINSIVPININIKANGYKDTTVKLSLFDNNRVFASQEIVIKNDAVEIPLYFEYETTIAGEHKITASFDEIKGEITNKNNTISEFIEVKKDKKRIILLAGSPSPDLSFIMNVLNDDMGIELKSYIHKYKDEYYNKSPQAIEFRNSDLIIMVGYPIKYTPNNDMSLINDALNDNKSLLFIASKDVDYSKLKMIENQLPFSVLASNNREFQAFSNFTKAAASHPLFKTNSDIPDLDIWNQLPPIIKTETFVKARPEAEILSQVKVNNVVLNEPLILTRTTANNRILAVLAYGLYKWKLLGFAQDKYRNPSKAQDLYSSFIKNSIQWLSTNDDKKNVSIKTLKRNYLENERIEFLAEVYDASLNPVDNANVNLNLADGILRSEVQLYPISNGRYTGYAEGLNEGEYYFSGQAKLNNISLGIDKGRFSVGDLSAEYLDLTMDINLLREISNRTGGRFYYNTDIDNLNNELMNDKIQKAKSLSVLHEFPLWNLPLILFVVIFLFGLEWFIRKRLGLI